MPDLIIVSEKSLHGGERWRREKPCFDVALGVMGLVSQPGMDDSDFLHQEASSLCTSKLGEVVGTSPACPLPSCGCKCHPSHAEAAFPVTIVISTCHKQGLGVCPGVSLTRLSLDFISPRHSSKRTQNPVTRLIFSFLLWLLWFIYS